jgi:hypothetical protein
MKRHTIQCAILLAFLWTADRAAGQVIIEESAPKARVEVEKAKPTAVQLAVLAPAPGKVISDSLLRVEGVARNISPGETIRLRLDAVEQVVQPDKTGRFSATLPLRRPGVNRLIVEAGISARTIAFSYQPALSAEANLLPRNSSPFSGVAVKKPETVQVEVEKARPESVLLQRRQAVKPSHILSPSPGEVVGKIIRVRGVVTQASGPVWLQGESGRQPVRVREDGSFEETVVLTSGENQILLGAGAETLDVVRVQAETPRTSLRIQLTWDVDLADVDLYTLQPDGGVVWFGGRSSALGFLDCDNTVGYGPEHFTLTSPVPGLFRVFVHYYAGWRRNVPYHVTILKNDQVFQKYDGVLTVSSAAAARPENIGRGGSWRHVADVSLP